MTTETKTVKTQLNLTPVEAFKLLDVLKKYPFFYTKVIENEEFTPEEYLSISHDLRLTTQVCERISKKLEGSA